MGELAENCLYLRKLEKLLENYKEPEVVIFCNNAEVSKVTGHKKCNAQKIYDKYKIKMVLKPDRKMCKGELKILR